MEHRQSLEGLMTLLQRNLVYSYFDNKPNLSVYDGKQEVATTPVNVNDGSGNATNNREQNDVFYH